MSVFDGILNLFDSIISFTDFEEIMQNLPDKSPDTLVINETITEVRKIFNEENIPWKKQTISDLISIYEEINTSLVYVPFVAFIRVFVRMIENIIRYHEEKGKTFVLAFPKHYLDITLGIKSNVIFSSVFVKYLKDNNKLSVISGFIFSSLTENNKQDDHCIGIFRNKPENFVLIDRKTIEEKNKENTLFIYCDDGLYSGVQFEEMEKSVFYFGVDLIPIIPFMRANYVPKHRFPDKEYHPQHETFPLATQMIKTGLCKTSPHNVLGYFQHKIPDDLSIGHCIPYLGYLSKKVGKDFGIFTSIIKNVGLDQSQGLMIEAEYKKIKYKKDVFFDEDSKTFFSVDSSKKENTHVKLFTIKDFEKYMNFWIESSPETVDVSRIGKILMTVKSLKKGIFNERYDKILKSLETTVKEQYVSDEESQKEKQKISLLHSEREKRLQRLEEIQRLESKLAEKQAKIQRELDFLADETFTLENEIHDIKKTIDISEMTIGKKLSIENSSKYDVERYFDLKYENLIDAYTNFYQIKFLSPKDKKILGDYMDEIKAELRADLGSNLAKLDLSTTTNLQKKLMFAGAIKEKTMF